MDMSRYCSLCLGGACCDTPSGVFNKDSGHDYIHGQQCRAIKPEEATRKLLQGSTLVR